jgi:lipid II:glycine glycyltransferase (peptidoglycan interpeptide bridge formation enzyme)
MAISFREVTDESVWDQFILAHAPGSIFQSWGWGEVQKSSGVRTNRIGIFEGSLLVGVAALTRTIAKRGRFLHVRHGPVLSVHTQTLWHEVTAYLRETARKEDLWFVRVSPQLAPLPANLGMFTSMHYRPAPIHAMDAEVCWVLDLAPTEEALLVGMRKSTRYEVRQAVKLGVRVRATTSVKDLDAFLSLYEKTASRQGFVAHRGVQEEFAYFAPRGQAALFLGYVGDELRSGALVLFWGDQAIYHHGASVPSREPVSAAVQWEAIREAKTRGMNIYNFWGIAPEGKGRHPWHGITSFKKGFGGQQIVYLHAQDLPVSPLYLVNWTVETARRISRGY